jgi:hypothetical protein
MSKQPTQLLFSAPIAWERNGEPVWGIVYLDPPITPARLRALARWCGRVAEEPPLEDEELPAWVRAAAEEP